MTAILNPIIPGMAPDPSILRVDDDYYIATSTFHWQPAVQVFHSTHFVNWELLTYLLKDGEVNLQGTNTPAGIWAPHLSYDKEAKRFWLIYSHMQNMAGREFNAEAYAMSAECITGPWTKPVYITSIGFDPSLFHENGHHYVACLEWETRTGYQAPGHLAIAEADLVHGGIIGSWHRITTNFTTRGCIEAPQLYHHGDFYYLLAAAGGTGYGHGVECGRAKHIFGPYEPDPTGEPIVTSSPRHLFSLGDPDAGHFEMYNPASPMQKAGHGSLVETKNGEWYLAHLMSRPLPDTMLNPLGRETSIQKVTWTDDGWLRLADGSNLAKMTVPAPQGTTAVRDRARCEDVHEDFSNNVLPLKFMTPYHLPGGDWARVRNGKLELCGRNSLFSQVAPSILATRATSMDYMFTTRVTFHPDHYSETAGAGLYYDANNWLYAHLALDPKEQRIELSILQAKLGTRVADDSAVAPIPGGTVELKFYYDEGLLAIFYRVPDDSEWHVLQKNLNVVYLSDEGVNGEPGEIGGFTGLFNFVGSVDAHQHDSVAYFDHYDVVNH